MKFFRCLVLPFGAVRSVHRLARAIWWIGVTGCKLLWTSFYNDFISYSKPALAACTESTVVTLFKLLGWVFAEDGDKCVPFADACDALGVFFNLGSSNLGCALAQNTEVRVAELCADLQAVLKEGHLGAKQAQRLRGRMQFGEAQMFGRTGRKCLRVLSEFAEGHQIQIAIPKTSSSWNLFQQLLSSNVPREVRSFGEQHAVIFTDACYEKSDEV